MGGYTELMTDEQFNTYNRLLELTGKVIRELPEEKRREYEELRDEILTNKKA